MLACADFETTTLEEDCRVWAYGICEIGNPDNFIYGNDIDDFMRICADKQENSTYYFHNLAFDGDFILYWLERNNFEHVKDKRDLENNTYTTLISDMGQFYSIEVCFNKKGHKTNKVTFFDSMKILNFSVAQIAEDFGTGLKKLEMESEFDENGDLINDGYSKIREIGHELTTDEIMYLRNDVEIMARALNTMFELGMNKMTIGSDALHEYKNTIDSKLYKRLFPQLPLDIDKVIRKSYKGGFTYLNEKYKGKVINGGLVFDVNSLYPSVMYNDSMPYGDPLYFDGQYLYDKVYPLYVQILTCQFKLKKDHIPMIQIKKSIYRYSDTEYLKDSGDYSPVLTLTSVDLELFLDHYDVFNLEYISGYKFKSSTTMFKKYIDKWITEKIENKKAKNKGKTQVAKLMLNSLYGKFAVSPTVTSKYPVYDNEKDYIRFVLGEEESRKALYIPVGAFITAWARNKTIRSAQKVYHRFIYADTDSLHLEGYDIPEGLDVDELKLGAWDNELIFSKGKYLRAKTYMEFGKKPKSNEEEKWKITCAGMPSKCHEFVELENFDIGAEYEGKLQKKRVPGGTILVEKEFTIRE